MPTTDPGQLGLAGADGRTALVLPRAWLQAQAVQARASLVQDQPWMAHGALALQNGWRQRLALVGPLRAGPPRPLPARPRGEVSMNWGNAPAPSHDGLCLLMLAPPGVQPPADTQLDPASWEHWLHTHAPDFRLACPQPSPAVAALWLRLEDGLALAALREQGRWQPLTHLNIQGAQFARAQLAQPQPAPANTPEAPPLHSVATPNEQDAEAELYAPERRDSRLAAALGPTVLNRLQRSRIAVLGNGRIGSILAHGLVRLGVAHLLVIDPDDMEPHNLDGDLPPNFEGRPKVEALSRFLRPLLRPGATVDARRLPIASPVAGDLLAETNLVIVCVDNDAARLWANAWALSGHTNLLALTTGQHTDPSTGQRLAAAELRLLPAGTGCLACLGGFAQASELLTQLQNPLPAPTPADVREQRPGSLRSWAGIAANLGLRMVEQLVAGDLDRALFRRLQETPDGGLQVQDGALPTPDPSQRCAFCTPLLGAGLAAVTHQRVLALAQRVVGENGTRR